MIPHYSIIKIPITSDVDRLFTYLLNFVVKNVKTLMLLPPQNAQDEPAIFSSKLSSLNVH